MWQLVLPLWLLLTSVAAAQTLTVAAASSYRPVLDAVAVKFEQTTGTQVRIVYGSSGKLAAQIQAGAPFDLYFSANAKFMDVLQDSGAVNNVTIDGYGQLALWTRTPRESALAPSHLIKAQRVAIAQPRHAPYGQAALAWLQDNKINLNSKLVYAENVAQAAQMVFSGAADVGLVALSVIPLDERSSAQLTILPLADNTLLQQLHGVVSKTEHAGNARQFSDYFQERKFDAMKRRFGLVPPTRVNAHD